MINRSIFLECITILNVYALNSGTSKYVRQNLTELHGEIDEFTISWRL